MARELDQIVVPLNPWRRRIRWVILVVVATLIAFFALLFPWKSREDLSFEVAWELVKQLKPDADRNEVVQLLGKPDGKVQSPAGEGLFWVYRKESFSEMHTDAIQIIFADGKISDRMLVSGDFSGWSVWRFRWERLKGRLGFGTK